MSQTYKVCTPAGAANSVVNISNGACSPSWTTYTTGDCNVYEKHRTLTFTSSVPSHTSFRIFYSYTVQYYENYDYTGQQTFQAWVTMAAGRTTATASVLCDYYAWCSSEYPPERSTEPASYAQE